MSISSTSDQLHSQVISQLSLSFGGRSAGWNIDSVDSEKLTQLLATAIQRGEQDKKQIEADLGAGATFWRNRNLSILIDCSLMANGLISVVATGFLTLYTNGSSLAITGLVLSILSAPAQAFQQRQNMMMQEYARLRIQKELIDVRELHLTNLFFQSFAKLQCDGKCDDLRKCLEGRVTIAQEKPEPKRPGCLERLWNRICCRKKAKESEEEDQIKNCMDGILPPAEELASLLIYATRAKSPAKENVAKAFDELDRIAVIVFGSFTTDTDEGQTQQDLKDKDSLSSRWAGEWGKIDHYFQKSDLKFERLKIKNRFLPREFGLLIELAQKGCSEGGDSGPFFYGSEYKQQVQKRVSHQNGLTLHSPSSSQPGDTREVDSRPPSFNPSAPDLNVANAAQPKQNLSSVVVDVD